MLKIANVSAFYGQHPALQDVSLQVGLGEVVVILGANGAGKSTLLRAISGICEGRVKGVMTLESEPLTALSSDQIVERGVALVSEGRGIFGDLTVKENLLLGAYSSRARRDENANLNRVLQLFPKLQERQGQIARTMSGGEQQMVAIGRAMMSAPKILMLDEPSLGLSPLLCKELFQNLSTVKELGIGILLVEQNAKQSLAIADRGYLLENTRITHENTAQQLARDPAVQKAYLGVGGDSIDGASKTNTAKNARISAVNKSWVSIPEARPQPRRTADQHIGLDIEGLVREASAISTESIAVQSHTAVTQNEIDQAATPRLNAVLLEIELAAKNARTKSSMQRMTRKPNHIVSATKAETRISDDANPVIIEIYRRPRVQIFRRRDGDFERD